MTDMIATGGILADTLDYANITPKALPSKPFTLFCKPNNGTTWTQNSEIRIPIPALKNLYAEQRGTYLRLTIRNNNVAGAADGTGTTKVRLSGGAHSVFSRVSIYHNSQLIDDIKNYNRVYESLLDFNVDAVQRNSTAYAIMQGCDNDKTTANQPTTARGGALITPASTKSFCIPILSSLFSAGLNNHAVPLSMLNNELILSLTLGNFADCFSTVNSTDALQASTAINWNLITVESVEFVVQCIKLPDEVDNALKAAFRGKGVRMPVSQYHSTRDSIVQGRAQHQILIPFHLQSLKSVIAGQYQSDFFDNGARNGVVSRTKNGLSSYGMRISGEPIPSLNIPADGASDYAELLKVFNGVSSVYTKSAVSAAEWGLGAENIDYGGHLICLNLDAMDNYSANRIQSGIRTVEGSTFLELNASPSFTTNATIIVIVHHDTELFIDEYGQLSATF